MTSKNKIGLCKAHKLFSGSLLRAPETLPPPGASRLGRCSSPELEAWSYLRWCGRLCLRYSWWCGSCPHRCYNTQNYTPLRTLMNVLLLISFWVLYEQTYKINPKGDTEKKGFLRSTPVAETLLASGMKGSGKLRWKLVTIWPGVSQRVSVCVSHSNMMRVMKHSCFRFSCCFTLTFKTLPTAQWG